MTAHNHYSVFRIEKLKIVSATTERHNLRRTPVNVNGQVTFIPFYPANVDKERTSNNQVLISPRGNNDNPDNTGKPITIMQAVLSRIREEGIKPRANQNLAIEVVLTGSPEVMNTMAEIQLNHWVDRSLKWAKKTFGEKNIVSAVLHMDEDTPHIHMIIVPIVSGVSRRTASYRRQREKDGAKMRPPKESIRLSADELVTKKKLYYYHTSYADDVGCRFGMMRGEMAEPGTFKTHKSQRDNLRELTRQCHRIEQELERLKEQSRQAEEDLVKKKEELFATSERQRLLLDSLNTNLRIEATQYARYYISRLFGAEMFTITSIDYRHRSEGLEVYAIAEIRDEKYGIYVSSSEYIAYTSDITLHTLDDVYAKSKDTDWISHGNFSDLMERQETQSLSRGIRQ